MGVFRKSVFDASDRCWRLPTALSAAVLLSWPGVSSAAPMSFGKLTTDFDQVIVDSLNNREWLRWDKLMTLTYAETVSAIAPGGPYDGWRIAGIQEAQHFTEALLFGRSNGCTVLSTTVTETCADGPLPDLTPFLGNNFTGGEDVKFFLSDNGTGFEVGLLQYYRGQQFDTVRKVNDWDTMSRSDLFALSPQPIGWLLYRDTGYVSLPNTISLVAVGLAALFQQSSRRRALRTVD